MQGDYSDLGNRDTRAQEFPTGCDYLVIATILHSHFWLESPCKARLLVRVYQLVNSQGMAFKATLERYRDTNIPVIKVVSLQPEEALIYHVSRASKCWFLI